MNSIIIKYGLSLYRSTTDSNLLCKASKFLLVLGRLYPYSWRKTRWVEYVVGLVVVFLFPLRQLVVLVHPPKKPLSPRQTWLESECPSSKVWRGDSGFFGGCTNHPRGTWANSRWPKEEPGEGWMHKPRTRLTPKKCTTSYSKDSQESDGLLRK